MTLWEKLTSQDFVSIDSGVKELVRKNKHLEDLLSQLVNVAVANKINISVSVLHLFYNDYILLEHTIYPLKVETIVDVKQCILNVWRSGTDIFSLLVPSQAPVKYFAYASIAAFTNAPILVESDVYSLAKGIVLSPILFVGAEKVMKKSWSVPLQLLKFSKFLLDLAEALNFGIYVSPLRYSTGQLSVFYMMNIPRRPTFEKGEVYNFDKVDIVLDLDNNRVVVAEFSPVLVLEFEKSIEKLRERAESYLGESSNFEQYWTRCRKVIRKTLEFIHAEPILKEQ